MKSIDKLFDVKYASILAAFLIVFGSSALIYGGTEDSTLKANAIKSMINGINSSNTGLAQSSIYLAGYHKYAWAVEPLIKVLNDSSKETFIRILAAHSLEMIGDEKGIQAVKTASLSEKNYIVKGTCEVIYNNYSERGAKTYSMGK